MEPPVIARGELKRQLFILEIIFAYIHMVAVRGNVVEGLAPYLFFFTSMFFLDIAKPRQLIFYLPQVIFRHGNV